MFLEYGISNAGRYVHISQVTSGRVPLVCPYCERGLIARKGRVKQHHFAHDGETCRESERDFESLDIPLFDRFHMYISSKGWKELQAFYNGKPCDTQALERHGFIYQNNYAYKTTWELTNPSGKIPFGLATLEKFSEFQLGKIYERHDTLAETVRLSQYGKKYGSDSYWIKPAPEMTQSNLIDLNIYRSQVARAFNLHLYLIEINNGQLYKIGVTSNIDRRLSEIKGDLSKLMRVESIKVLRLCKNRGAVERYALFRYQDHSKPLTTLTEYFEFDKDTRRKVLSDFTRLGNFDSNGLVSSIVCGDMSDIELAINEEILKQNISKGTRRGMARAKAKGIHVGRPQQENSELLAKYPHVVKALNDGLSLRRTAELCNVSVNTVRKVKTILKSNGAGMV